MNQAQSNPQNSSNISKNPPQDVQPETGTRDFEDEEIRQSSPANPRVSEKSEQAPEEA